MVARPLPGPPGENRPRRRRVRQIADQLRHRVSGKREVRLEDPGVLAGLPIHRARQSHHAGALRALPVGNVGFAAVVNPEVVNDPRVSPFDWLDQLTALLDYLVGGH